MHCHNNTLFSLILSTTVGIIIVQPTHVANQALVTHLDRILHLTAASCLTSGVILVEMPNSNFEPEPVRGEFKRSVRKMKWRKQRWVYFAWLTLPCINHDNITQDFFFFYSSLVMKKNNQT